MNATTKDEQLDPQDSAAAAVHEGGSLPGPEVFDVEDSLPVSGGYTGGRSLLSDDVVALLNEPLDRSRVKSRDGRGGGSFSYLETHDIVRTANEIFGYGAWGHRIVEQDRIAEVEVQSSGQSSRKGWHIAYRCVVELTVRGCIPISGSGYGDGVEYGPAALATASELALKESESDALKRAFKNFGDQFGLILYAKGDDQARIERDAAADQARAVRGDAPVTLNDALDRLGIFVEDGKPWVREAVEKLHAGVEFTSINVLADEQKFDLLRRLMEVVIGLEGQEFDPHADAEDTQRRVRAAFAAAFEGLEILGPDPFKGAIPF